MLHASESAYFVSGTVPKATKVNNTTMVQIGMMTSEGHRRFVMVKPGRHDFFPNPIERKKRKSRANVSG